MRLDIYGVVVHLDTPKAPSSMSAGSDDAITRFGYRQRNITRKFGYTRCGEPRSSTPNQVLVYLARGEFWLNAALRHHGPWKKTRSYTWLPATDISSSTKRAKVNLSLRKSRWWLAVSRSVTRPCSRPVAQANDHGFTRVKIDRRMRIRSCLSDGITD